MDKVETMLHPFNNEMCEVQHLQPGDVVFTGDLYRSATVLEATSALGKWYAATDTINGTSIGVDCNVHFVRLKPIVE